ncbi:MAG: alpha/beta hydrolase [Gemmatimonadetes bacterium]|nr:alpha/beta hydrolase [Gemmatimonadota bacterium]
MSCSRGSDGSPVAPGESTKGSDVGLRPFLAAGVDPVSNCTVPTVPPADSVNLVTRKYATVNGLPMKLDLAYPKRGGPHPLVVVVHGGHWNADTRVSVRNVIRLLAGQGYAAAAPDYRLAAAPNNVFPAAVQDVRCAVRWLKANGSTYGVDVVNVASYGFGAGGHLASMLGTSSDVAGLDGACATPGSPAVNAVVSLAGTHDLRDGAPMSPELLSDITNFLGAPPSDVPQAAALASPLVHVGSSDPDYLLIQRTLDPLNPVAQSRNMKAALDAAGVPATLVELTGSGHSFNPFGSSRSMRVSACTIMAFLDQQLR